jgi:hypothetical protein
MASEPSPPDHNDRTRAGNAAEFGGRKGGQRTRSGRGAVPLTRSVITIRVVPSGPSFWVAFFTRSLPSASGFMLTPSGTSEQKLLNPEAEPAMER